MNALRRSASFGLDFLLIMFATVVATLLRDNFDNGLQSIIHNSTYHLTTAGVALAALLVLRPDRSIWRYSSSAVIGRVVVLALTIVLGSLALTFIFDRLTNVARALPLIQGLLIVAFMLTARTLARVRQRRRQRPGQLQEPISAHAEEIELVVGLNWLSDAYLRSVQEYGHGRRAIAGILSTNERHIGRLVGNFEVLGTPKHVEYILNALSVEGVNVTRILLACSKEELTTDSVAALHDAAQKRGIVMEMLLQRLGVDGPVFLDDISDDGAVAANVVPILPNPQTKPDNAASALLDTSSRTREVRALAHPTFVVSRDVLDELSKRHYWLWKRLLDVVVSSTAIVLLSPLFLIVTALVAVFIGQPIFFKQRRPGLGGLSFRLYKFRTLGPAFDPSGRVIPNEKRLSKLGNFLRRTRLDELPQLYSILIGDMSFVGPRPLLAAEQSEAFRARLMVRPGLAGWAQVCGGRDIPAADKAALDIWYVHNASLWLDMCIMIKTIPIIVFGERISRQSIEKSWNDLRQAGVTDGSSFLSAG